MFTFVVYAPSVVSDSISLDKPKSATLQTRISLTRMFRAARSWEQTQRKVLIIYYSENYMFIYSLFTYVLKRTAFIPSVIKNGSHKEQILICFDSPNLILPSPYNSKWHLLKRNWKQKRRRRDANFHRKNEVFHTGVFQFFSMHSNQVDPAINDVHRTSREGSIYSYLPYRHIPCRQGSILTVIQHLTTVTGQDGKISPCVHMPYRPDSTLKAIQPLTTFSEQEGNYQPVLILCTYPMSARQHTKGYTAINDIQWTRGKLSSCAHPVYVSHVG